MVAHRLRPGLTGWWAALVLLGYEWSFGLERLGTVWAPYAIALPSALLVLLVADLAVSRDPWPAAITAAVCASFLLQTDIGTTVLVLVVVVSAPLVRLATRAATAGTGQGTGQRTGDDRAGEGTEGRARHWRSRVTALGAVVVVLWLPALIQQVSTSPGNVVQAYRFLTTHHTVRTLAVSLKAADTLFGFFPFRFEEEAAKRDAKPTWLVDHAVWDHPWFLLYIGGMVSIGIAAVLLRKRPALALAASTSVGILAAGWSILLVYGPLFPYLVIWTGALVIPAWIAAWLVFAPPVPATSTKAARAAASTEAAGRPPSPRPARLTVPIAGVPVASVPVASVPVASVPVASVPVASVPVISVPVISVIVAAAVCAGFAFSRTPLTDGSARLARLSWSAVAGAALAPQVNTVYVDIANREAMPEAAAIADQAVRHHRRVELNPAALYFLDPSFAPRWVAQLKVVVCCGRSDPRQPAPGLALRGLVGGQRIFIQAGGPSRRHQPTRKQRAPSIGRIPSYLFDKDNDSRAHPL